MKIKVDDKDVEFEKTDQQLKYGQISGLEKSIYKDVNHNSLWRFKLSNVLNEYLGFAAYKALGINVPNFNIGVIDKEEQDCAGSLIFVQEYIDASEEISIDKLDAISTDIANKIIPIILASFLIQDWDVTGPDGSNILLIKSQKDPQNLLNVIKIDCGRAFNSNDCQLTASSSGKHFNGLVNDFILHNQNEINFIEQISLFLSNINIEIFNERMSAAYNAFEGVIEKSLPEVKVWFEKQIKQYERDVYSKAAIGPIAHLQNQEIKNVDDILEKVKRNIIILREYVERRKVMQEENIARLRLRL